MKILSVTGKMTFLLLAVSLLFELSCRTYDDEGNWKGTIRMVNKSKQEVHMWTDSESQEPLNSLQPTQSRSVSQTYEGWKVLQFITVYAGRDGATLAETSVMLAPATNLGIVEWDGSALSVTHTAEH